MGTQMKMPSMCNDFMNVPIGLNVPIGFHDVGSNFNLTPTRLKLL